MIIDGSQKSQGKINALNNVDRVPSNVQFSHQEAFLFVFEDNEAVIKMIIKGRSPTMRHVSRTHRVALDWLFDRDHLGPKIQIKYIDTKNQLADILTKGNFTRDEWNLLLCLFNISHFSSTDCSEVMSKETHKESGQERVTAKSRPMMSLIARAPSTLSSSASESREKKSFGNQSPWSAKSETPVVCPQGGAHQFVKSTSGGTLCVFGSHTFVPISWMCKKQAAVSHSSTESEIISLDTGLRLDGLLALELWDLIVSVLGNVSRVSDRSLQTENDDHKHHKSHKKIDVMKDIDSVPSNVQSSHQEALLCVFEDNEAVINMILKEGVRQ